MASGTASWHLSMGVTVATQEAPTGILALPLELIRLYLILELRHLSTSSSDTPWSRELSRDLEAVLVGQVQLGAVVDLRNVHHR